MIIALLKFQNAYLVKQLEKAYQNLDLAGSGTFHYPLCFIETEGSQ